MVDAATGEIRLLREGALPWSRVLEFLGTPPSEPIPQLFDACGVCYYPVNVPRLSD